MKEIINTVLDSVFNEYVLIASSLWIGKMVYLFMVFHLHRIGAM